MARVNPNDAARLLRELPGRLRYGATRAVERSLDVIQERAEDLSSGRLGSQEDFRREGHPYRRGGGPRRQKGAAGYPPEVINVQDGEFVQAWAQEGPGGTPDSVSGAVVNTDPKAELLEGGTRVMIARPLPEAVVRETEAEVEQIFTEELGDALRR